MYQLDVSRIGVGILRETDWLEGDFVMIVRNGAIRLLLVL